MNESPTDRRIQRTTQLLKEALVDLMLEKSYEKITVQNIIDRANVGRATFYNHFLDKDDLLLRGVAEISHDAVAETSAAEEIPPPDPRPKHTLPTAGMFQHSRENKRLHQVMFKRNRENPILRRTTAFLYERVEKELKELAEIQIPAVPIPVMAQFITGGLMSLIEWWHDKDFPYTPEEMEAFFEAFVMPGTLRVLEK